ncbi:MAG: ATP-dependent helicase HrpB [Phycisphaerales bacterium]|nr:ATP-dependent helicase HrpB [Phycisphaerales bacterium]
MTPLPIDSHLPEIVARVRAARSLVLVAPPGAGKTTRVPPAILRAGLLSAGHPNLVMLQPRRVAARASAQRIADENGWALGREVGYHIRFEKRIGPETRLRVLTEGILTRQLLEDPFLEGTGAVLLDEFHERSLHTDMSIAMLREIRQTVRDDLILIVMSATLEAEPVAKFLGDCPIIRTEGRTFPIEITYANAAPAGRAQDIPDRVADALTDLLTASSHDAPDDSSRSFPIPAPPSASRPPSPRRRVPASPRPPLPPTTPATSSSSSPAWRKSAGPRSGSKLSHIAKTSCSSRSTAASPATSRSPRCAPL